MAFETKITRARFVLGPFTAEQMDGIGQSVLDSIAARIRRGENCNDAAAKPLKPGRISKGRVVRPGVVIGAGRQLKGYPDYKIARGLAPIRDWTWRGKTMRSFKVKSASENRVVIGFVDDEADRIAHANNLREKQFGVSPRDREVLNRAVMDVVVKGRIVRFQRVA